MALPELFGSYVLHYRLAEGSTSEIFLAQTTGDFPRLCAIKRIRPQLAALPEFSARFREDAAHLVRLIHGNLVQILEVGATDDKPFVAMEQIDGVKLEQLLATTSESGPLPPEAALHIALEAGEAISYLARRRAEEAGDGELSADRAWPMEVMLSFDGVVKLVDLGSFGALRIGQQSVHSIFQSPGYTVPEVIRKAPLDSRSDVFTVGLLLWEALSGRRLVADAPEPFVGAVLDGTWKAPLIDRKDVPGTVIRTVDQMLRLDPDDRPDTLDRARPELVAALRRLSPSYGSSDLSWLLAERCADEVSHLAELTATVTRGAKRSSHDRPAVSTTTMTYGRAGEIDRPMVEPVKLEVGDRIPGTRYRLVRKLGSGGSAEVFCAQHIDLERQVAIKILDHELARQSGAIAQFRMEARACSRIGHPNIVDVIDFGELDDGRFFFAMELVEGDSLAEILAAERRLPVERALPIFRQAAKALGAAHEHHIIHRDMKPENIMLTKSKDGREDLVKVLDFGVMAFASDTAAECVGTPGYMAPEQIEGAMPTPQMDIYALGATLYETISGTLPYPGETLTEYAAQQAAGPAIALGSLPSTKGLHSAIERVVHRALERSADARQLSCADLEADLVVAQREAGIHSDWDDLTPPTGMLDTRRNDLTLPGAPGAGRGTGGQRALESEQGLDTLPARRSAAMIWLVALGVVVFGMVGMLAFWPDDPKPAPGSGTTFQPRRVRTSPRPDAAPEGALPAALAALLEQAKAAAARGHFSQPKGESAYDRLLAVEAARPQNEQTKALRKRFAGTLEGMGDQLAKRGFKGSARTLYREALLFTPDSERLRSLAAADASTGRRGLRPEQRTARIAHLVALIDRAVIDGRLLKPPRKNALSYLWKLKKLDPDGKGTARVQKLMTEMLRKRAEAAWANAARRAAARQLYARIARLDPADKLAKKRAKGAAKAPAIAKAPKTAPKAKGVGPDARLETDAAKAKALVAEGNKLLASGAAGKAKSKYNEARALDPKSAGAFLGLARSCFNLNKLPSAVVNAKKALQLSPNNTRALLVLGDAYFGLGRKTQAKEKWQKVLKIKPGHKAAQKRLARVSP